MSLAYDIDVPKGFKVIHKKGKWRKIFNQETGKLLKQEFKKGLLDNVQMEKYKVR